MGTKNSHVSTKLVYYQMSWQPREANIRGQKVPRLQYILQGSNFFFFIGNL